MDCAKLLFYRWQYYGRLSRKQKALAFRWFLWKQGE